MKRIGYAPLAFSLLVGLAVSCGSNEDAALVNTGSGTDQSGIQEVSTSLAGADIVELGNTVCPVMGQPVAEGQHVDWNGYRINICCPGCDGVIREDPLPYIQVLAGDESIPEEIRAELQVLCTDASGSPTSGSGSCGGCQ